MKQAANEQARRNEMLTRPIPRVVAKLALPAVVTQLITLIYNTADTYFVSQINKSASAGVGATFAVMSLIHAITARFKIEHLFKFYWTVVAGLAVLSLVLVWAGL